MLPFVEAESTWRAGALVAVGAPNKVFFCPSRRDPQTVTYADEYTPPVTGGNVTHALCDYAAGNWEGTGVVRRYDPLRILDITDGTSTTLLAGDKRLNLLAPAPLSRGEEKGQAGEPARGVPVQAHGMQLLKAQGINSKPLLLIDST